jgi:sec-independent protein translocase protein TatA
MFDATAMLALGWPGPFEMMLIAGFGLLIFGKRLPEVARGLGKSVVEFKKGLNSVEDSIEQPSSESSKPSASKPAAKEPHPGA